MTQFMSRGIFWLETLNWGLLWNTESAVFKIMLFAFCYLHVLHFVWRMTVNSEQSNWSATWKACLSLVVSFCCFDTSFTLDKD